MISEISQPVAKLCNIYCMLINHNFYGLPIYMQSHMTPHAVSHDTTSRIFHCATELSSGGFMMFQSVIFISCNMICHRQIKKILIIFDHFMDIQETALSYKMLYIH